MMDRSLVEIQSRVLPCETLYANHKTYNSGQTGVWANQIWSNKMHMCDVLKSFVVLAPQKFLDQLKKFLRNIK